MSSQFFSRKKYPTTSPRHFAVTERASPDDDPTALTSIVIDTKDLVSSQPPPTGSGTESRKGSSTPNSTAKSPLASIPEDEQPALPLLMETIQNKSLDPRGGKGLARLPLEKPYPCLSNFLEHQFDAYHVTFLRAMLTKKGGGLLWFMWDLLPQVVVMVALILLVYYLDIYYPGWFEIKGDIQRIHGFIGSILAFVLVFRSNCAYDRYYEGRKTLGVMLNQTRELILEVYSIIPKSENSLYKKCREELRRKVNIMFGFIRQHVRESQVGFVPCSIQARHDFFDEPLTFTNDPSRPRFCDLLTQKEADIYSQLKSSSRAACVAAEIKGIVQIMMKNVEYPLPLWTKAGSCLQVCLDAQETLYRITTTPVPFPYSYITNTMCTIFVFATPFLYSCGLTEKFLGCVSLVFAYYGCMTMSHQLENPCGWDTFDLDVEKFTMWTHEESLDIAYFCTGNRRTFISKDLLN